MKDSRKTPDAEDDWGPFGPALRVALEEQGIDPTGKTFAQAAREAGVAGSLAVTSEHSEQP